MDCIFCKIVNGEIPSQTIYEDDLFKVILDKFPSGRGHTLIVAKKHVKDIFELDEETAAALFPLAAKVTAALKKVHDFPAVNIVQNNGVEAGQTIFHFHMHIIPRYDGDNVQIKWGKADIPEAEFESMANALRDLLV